MNTQSHHTLGTLRNKDAMELANVKVAILLCTYNGAEFLDEQLQSIIRQTHKNWVIYASDDGSDDDTLGLLTSAQQSLGESRLVIFNGPRQGFAKNFLSLIKNESITADYFAFSDQDDIWFEDKLERSITQLHFASGTPAFYCSRTRLISADKRVLGFSPLFSAPPHFCNALVQSIAGANTMLINTQARALLALTPEDAVIVAHDWLTYLLITGCGGKVIYDPLPTLDYRQHSGNLIGANAGFNDKLVRISKMWSGRFSEWSNQNLLVLESFQQKLTQNSQLTLDRFKTARKSSFFQRIRLMKKAGVYRQTAQGNVSLFAAVCLNCI
ncbi:Glycosyl transferase family 2 [Pseudomonas sp. ok272]|uniref:glycosyltransferase family 2 protein n=1 Tax=unclassified Pseudomonas TaxID=196821 RepID=UPI0008B9955C|nr:MULTISPECIES: glycosyltransferase family 2 protein [unclassified Pseudomonas]SEN06359.1 Glycosyl transferase family 2 [Pseudomonas sp. ok272]SFN00175.1 Glycosyl transferase family 2 [Pseudomonas sp. ok602]